MRVSAKPELQSGPRSPVILTLVARAHLHLTPIRTLRYLAGMGWQSGQPLTFYTGEKA